MTLTVSRVFYLLACLIFIGAVIGLGGPVNLVAAGLAFVAAGLAVG